MSGPQKKVQERGMGNFQPSVCISRSANENPSVIIASSSFLNSSLLHCELSPTHFARHSKWRACLQGRQKESKLFKSQIITFQTSHYMRADCITLDPYFCSYVCHVLLSFMLHEFLWVRKLLMYNILPLGVLFYLGTNSWLTGEAANK